MKSFENSQKKPVFNIEKKKQIMHASYDVSFEIAQGKKNFSDRLMINDKKMRN